MFNGLKLDAAVKDVMRRDVLEASLTALTMKLQKNLTTATALHKREPCCLEDTSQNF